MLPIYTGQRFIHNHVYGGYNTTDSTLDYIRLHSVCNLSNYSNILYTIECQQEARRNKNITVSFVANRCCENTLDQMKFGVVICQETMRHRRNILENNKTFTTL